MKPWKYKDADLCELIVKQAYYGERKRCRYRRWQTRFVAGRSAAVCRRHADRVDKGEAFEVCDGSET